MPCLLKNAVVYDKGSVFRRDISLSENRIAFNGFDAIPSDISKYNVFPGFADVHVHFREPGFSYRCLHLYSALRRSPPSVPQGSPCQS